jgi:hypothetical protein
MPPGSLPLQTPVAIAIETPIPMPKSIPPPPAGDDNE